MAGWETDLALLQEEIIQRKDEGYGIPDSISREITDLGEKTNGTARLLSRYLLPCKSFRWTPSLRNMNPTAFPAFSACALRTASTSYHGALEPPQLLDRLHGAWTGRCAGCASGKPVEGIGMRRINGKLTGRKDIKNILLATNDWPLHTYIPSAALALERKRQGKEFTMTHHA